MMGHKPYPDGKFWAEPSDPPDFRRFLNLRDVDEYSVCQTMLVWFGVPSSFRVLSVASLSLVFRTFASTISAADANRIKSRNTTARSKGSSTHEFSTISCRSAMVEDVDSIGW